MPILSFFSNCNRFSFETAASQPGAFGFFPFSSRSEAFSVDMVWKSEVFRRKEMWFTSEKLWNGDLQEAIAAGAAGGGGLTFNHKGSWLSAGELQKHTNHWSCCYAKSWNACGFLCFQFINHVLNEPRVIVFGCLKYSKCYVCVSVWTYYCVRGEDTAAVDTEMSLWRSERTVGVTAGMAEGKMKERRVQVRPELWTTRQDRRTRVSCRNVP